MLLDITAELLLRRRFRRPSVSRLAQKGRMAKFLKARGALHENTNLLLTFNIKSDVFDVSLTDTFSLPF